MVNEFNNDFENDAHQKEKRKDSLLLIVPGEAGRGIGHHRGPRGEAMGESAGREMGRAGAGSLYCGFLGRDM